jgi:THO complex subunit 4
MAVDGMMRGGGGRQANAQAGGRTKLVVGNLDFKVNDRDIKVRRRATLAWEGPSVRA